MSSWQFGDVAVNGVKIHYTRTGGRTGGRTGSFKPPVVLAHGFADDGLCWTPVAEALEADYDVVMVDARGHGRSDAPAQGYGAADHANDLAGVITALGLQRPAVLGHSMGAVSALALAGMHPELPRAILLEDPPPRWIPTGPAPARPSPIHQAIIDLKRKTREELLAHAARQLPPWPKAELAPWADAKLRFSFNVLLADEPPALDWPGIVHAITCPALLITADPAQGAIITPEVAASLGALLPQTRVAHIAGAGHNIRREQFGSYMKAVSAFLAETKI